MNGFVQLQYHDVDEEQGKRHQFDCREWQDDETYRRHLCLLLIDDLYAIARHNTDTELE